MLIRLYSTAIYYVCNMNNSEVCGFRACTVTSAADLLPLRLLQRCRRVLSVAPCRSRGCSESQQLGVQQGYGVSSVVVVQSHLQVAGACNSRQRSCVGCELVRWCNDECPICSANRQMDVIGTYLSVLHSTGCTLCHHLFTQDSTHHVGLETGFTNFTGDVAC